MNRVPAQRQSVIDSLNRKADQVPSTNPDTVMSRYYDIMRNQYQGRAEALQAQPTVQPMAAPRQRPRYGSLMSAAPWGIR